MLFRNIKYMSPFSELGCIGARIYPFHIRNIQQGRGWWDESSKNLVGVTSMISKKKNVFYGLMQR